MKGSKSTLKIAILHNVLITHLNFGFAGQISVILQITCKEKVMARTTENINKFQGQEFKIRCYNCERITNHIVKLSLEKIFENDKFFSGFTYQIIECKGCEMVSFRSASQSTDKYYVTDDGNYEFPINQLIYPHRDEDTIATKEFLDLPRSIRDTYEETIHCFNYGCRILCGAGLRAVIEYLCVENGLKKGNLADKIRKLQKKGILTEKHADTLHELRLIGNDAVHNKVEPTTEELKNAIDIIEHTFESIYNLHRKAEEISDTRSKRKG